MKKVMIGIVVVLLIALAVPAAYAAVNADKQKEIDTLNKQIIDTRKQVIDKYVEAGQITQDQAKLAKDRLDQVQQNLQNNGGQYGPGLGGGLCGRRGSGACGGPGTCLGGGVGPRAGVTPNSY